MTLFVLIGALLFSFTSYGHAKDIYRWTDENGATHYADKVPKKFEHTVRKVDAHVNELNTNRQRVVVDAPIISLPSTVASSPQGVQVEIMGSGESAGSGGTGGSDDCSTMRRKYWESQECFQRYRNANGSVKAEAYQHCAVVTNPVEQCGPVITEP